MAGAEILIEHHGLAAAEARLRALAGFQAAELLDDVGALLESSTRDRLHRTKAGPDGAPWAPWSERYAKTRGAEHSLLVGENELLDSVAHRVGPRRVSVGSNKVYAAIHQFGGAEVGRPEPPARPWLGLSAEDRGDIDDLVRAALLDALGPAA